MSNMDRNDNQQRPNNDNKLFGAYDDKIHNNAGSEDRKAAANRSNEQNSRENHRQADKSSFNVNIPDNIYREYDRGTAGGSGARVSRPVKRDEIPKRNVRAEEMPRSESEILADKMRADEYARQVRLSAQRARARSAAVARNRTGANGGNSNQRPAYPAMAPMNDRRSDNSNNIQRAISDETQAALDEYEQNIRNHEANVKRKNEESKKVKTHALEFQFVNAAVCMLAVMGVFFALLFMTREHGFIQSENRNLATFPSFSLSSYFKGSFTGGVTTYFTDTIPNREKFKTFCSDFTGYFGVKLNDTVIGANVKKVEKETVDKEVKVTTVTANTGKVTTTKADSSTTKVTKSTTKEKVVKVPDNLDDGQWEGNVIVSGSGKNVRAVGAYYGTFSNGNKYATAINKWKAELGDSVNVYNMSIPLSSAYYMPKNLKDTVSDQKENIDNIASHLKDVVNVDVYNTLAEHTTEYIYSRTDHHWQPLGAYYASTVFAKLAGIESPALKTYEKCQIKGFTGTMYAYSNYNQELKNYPDTFTYYKPDNKYTVKYYDTSFKNGVEGDMFFDYASGVNCYSAILNVDTEIVEVKTDCKNDRVLVVFKDSFGNALVPYYTHGFSKIYVCDFRYFDINGIDFCKKVGCTDLLFSISLSSCSTPTQVDCINNCRVQ